MILLFRKPIRLSEVILFSFYMQYLSFGILEGICIDLYREIGLTLLTEKLTLLIHLSTISYSYFIKISSSLI
jgi:hypothetical protein